jgi:Chaperone of endosialidase
VNSFFGAASGAANTTGQNNSFFGEGSGFHTATGNSNSFFGSSSGFTNSSGTNNTIIGNDADVGPSNLTNATAVGSNALVARSNSLVLGSIDGVNFATADTNVGIGTTTPNSRLDVQGNIAIGLSAAPIGPGNNNLYIANDSGDDGNVFRFDGSSDNLFMVARSNAGAAAGTNIGFRTASAGGGEITRMIINSTGTITINTLGTAGSTALCRNASNEISTCSSSLRYKTNITGFSSGLSFINRLRPISFSWKADGIKDIGFGAEDVAKIDPRFVTYNEKGEVEGVKYDRLSAAFVNAFKEQQAQIERQQKQIEALTQALCSFKPAMQICKQKE